TAAEQDSLTYIAAENVYITGDCDKSITNFENYIQQFPNGNFIINSHYYNAECYYLKNELGSALNSYEYVIAKPKNTFTELSLLRAAQIHNRMGNYEKAYHYYNELEISASTKNILYESRLGLMRTAVKLNDYQKIIESCDKILITEQMPVEIQREAQFLKATALYKSGKLNDALTIYRIISTEVISKEGAESKYMVAKILFQLKVIDKAKLEIMDFISKGTSHQYWLAKSIILLSDIHHLNKDNFQAKATLQSLIDNYQNTEDGIIDEANQKILTLIKQEKEKEYVDKQEEIKLKFEDNKDGKYDGLFENEINSDTINNAYSDTMQLF
ncbi:MAG: hypothetical protein JXB17_08710, partial [Bacteroidales bacterium]|nr:hypothetical protein [Bacteroidales bacterium]